MSRGRVGAVLLIFCLATAASVMRTAGSRLDRAVEQWIGYSTASTRVLLRVRYQAAERVVQRMIDPMLWGDVDAPSTVPPSSATFERANGDLVRQ